MMCESLSQDTVGAHATGSCHGAARVGQALITFSAAPIPVPRLGRAHRLDSSLRAPVRPLP